MARGRQVGSKNKKPGIGRDTNSVGVGEPLAMMEAYLPPSSYDYKETMLLLRDFGISSVTPPVFQTKNSLFHWRSRTIQAALA